MDMIELRRRVMLSMIGGKAKLVETGTYTPAVDENASNVHISHSLGVVPDFVIAMSEPFEAITSMTERYVANSYFSKMNLQTSNLSGAYQAYYLGNWVERDTAWQSYENLSTSKFLHENNFEIPYYNSTDKLKAGVTYHYVVGKYE